jgi:epoxide hydrolase 4
MTEHITVAANGLSFHVVTEGTGDRLALCLHGFPASSASFRPQIPLLTRLGYRVWIPDMRGYGRSSKPHGVAAYTVDELEQDVAALIDASGAKQVTLIGHDWGAVVAWSFALNRVRPLERLVVFNVPHPMLFERGLRTLRQLRRSWYMLLFQLPWLPERLLGSFGGYGVARVVRTVAADKANFPAALVEAHRQSACAPGALTSMLNYYRAIPRRVLAKDRPKYPTLHTPTLVMYSEGDPAVGKELFDDTARYVTDLTQRMLPGTSHWLPDEAPELVNPVLEAFLTRDSAAVSVQA